MSIFAIGDVQGCYLSLQKLLDHIQFDPQKHTLWFTGDLVNRGDNSLEVLRFIKNLGDKHIAVLGNHDLHLLAVYYQTAKLKTSDTLHEVLMAPDVDEIMTWLRHLPLLHYDQASKFVMTHAGIAPPWSLDHAKRLAKEVEDVLRDEHKLKAFLPYMYGNQPDIWHENLTGNDRLRCITNYFTRMRLCDIDGRLDFSYQGRLIDKPAELLPWFELPNRLCAAEKIIFGHWAALGGEAHSPNVYPLDTGCVWGNCLTAMRLSDQKRFSVDC